MSYLRRFASSFSAVGLIAGLGLACISLTPSMLPRAVLVQSVLAGLVFALGYGIGATLHDIWKYMGLKSFTGKTARFSRTPSTVRCGAGLRFPANSGTR